MVCVKLEHVLHYSISLARRVLDLLNVVHVAYVNLAFLALRA